MGLTCLSRKYDAIFRDILNFEIIEVEADIDGLLGDYIAVSNSATHVETTFLSATIGLQKLNQKLSKQEESDA